MAINISIASDVTDVIRGTKDMAKGLEDVADELESLERADVDKLTKNLDDAEDATKDLAKTVDKSSEKIEDSLDDAGDGADKLEKKMRDAFRSTAQDAKASADKIGKSQKDGFKKASEGADEFGREANSTAKESAASFDGSADSIISSFQEVAANAFAGFGPAGAAAGLAVAAGVGIAISKMQKLAEENDERQQEVADLAAEYSDLGGIIDRLNIGDRISEWGREVNGDNWLTFWTDEAETNFQKYAELARKAGTTTEDTFKGIKGTVEDSKGFLSGTQEEFERLNQAVKDGTRQQGNYGTTLTAAGKEAERQRDALKDLRDAAEKNIETTGEAIEIAEIEAEATGQTNDQLHRQVELKNELADKTKSAIETELDYIETSAATRAELAEAEKTMDKNTEAGRKNQRTVLEQIEATNDYNQSQVDAGETVAVTNARLEKQRQSLVNMLEPFFGSKAAAKAYIDQVLKAPSRVDTDVNLNGIADAEEELNHLTRRRGTLIDVRADTSSAEYAIANLNGRRVVVHADFVARPGVPVYQ